MAVTYVVDGVDRSNLAQRKSLGISHKVNQRSTASFEFKDPSGTYRPDVGDPVTISDGATLVFGGTVDEYEEQKLPGTSPWAVRHVIPLVDYHQLADRRSVHTLGPYESVTAGSIVTDIVTLLAGEGVTAGTIQAGPTLTKVVPDYRPATWLLDEICKLTGMQWRINADKTLDLFERATFIGTAITTTSPIRDVFVRRHREGYRNRQFIRAGKGITAVQTDELPAPLPDGQSQTFTLRFQVAKAPTVTLNAGAQTVGIRGLDTGKDWYWAKGEGTITQDTGATPLADTDVLRVTYQGLYDIVVQSDDEAAQAERAAAEGGTGIYEDTESRPDIESDQAASDAAQGDLRRYARISEEVSFATDDLAYEPGQIVSITLPEHGIAGDYLVSEVNISDRGRGDQGLTYQVKALSGEAVGGWTMFFRALIQQSKTFSIREGEVLVRNLILSDTVTMSEGVTVNVVGVTETYDADLLTVNITGLSDPEDAAYTTYNAVGVTDPLDGAVGTINLLGWTDPADYDPSRPLWSVQGVTPGTEAGLHVLSMTPVTTVGDGLVGYSEVSA